MPEEIRPDSLSHSELRAPGIDAVADEAQRLEGREVFDANGARFGRVTKAFVDGGKLRELEVTLGKNMKGSLGPTPTRPASRGTPSPAWTKRASASSRPPRR